MQNLNTFHSPSCPSFFYLFAPIEILSLARKKRKHKQTNARLLKKNNAKDQEERKLALELSPEQKNRKTWALDLEKKTQKRLLSLLPSRELLEPDERLGQAVLHPLCRALEGALREARKLFFPDA